MRPETKTILDKIVEMTDEKKGENIKTFHIENGEWITDYVVLVGASNRIHCEAIVNEYKDKLYESIKGMGSTEFYDEWRQSGSSESGWIVIDLNAILVHCVTQEIRDYYKLDTLFEKYGIVYHH